MGYLYGLFVIIISKSSHKQYLTYGTFNFSPRLCIHKRVFCSDTGKWGVLVVCFPRVSQEGYMQSFTNFHAKLHSNPTFRFVFEIRARISLVFISEIIHFSMSRGKIHLNVELMLLYIVIPDESESSLWQAHRGLSRVNLIVAVLPHVNSNTEIISQSGALCPLWELQISPR